jgi:uncharacterized coiled-coil protein SlyX
MAKMTIEERVDKIETALGKQDDLVIELRDALTVTAALEAQHGRMMKDHAEWLIGHDRAMIEFREKMEVLDARRREETKEWDERIAKLQEQRREDSKELDERIAKLVSGFGEFLRRER